MSGSLFVDGQPAEGAVIVFHLVNGSSGSAESRPSARVAADGTFALSTKAENDGARPGEYAVAVAWLASGPHATSDTGEVAAKLPVQYADPSTTPLRASITAGANVLPAFNLTTR